jgi:hypothetical protein
MSDKTVEWFCVEQSSGKRMPEWMRSVAVGDDGTIFAPAAMSGNEKRAMLCASWDGVPAVLNAKHVYLPVKWLAKEYPELAGLVRRIERRLGAELSHPASPGM